MIHLVDTVHKPVTAVATFALLDKAEVPVHKYTRTTDAKTLGGPGKDSFIGWERFMTRQDLKRSGYLKNDCFSIRIHVHVVKEVPSVVVPPPDIHRHIGNLLSSKEGMDVEFQVGGEAFIAHRRLLGARSPVFRAELFGPMKEGTGTNIVTVHDMEPQVFSSLLTFIYTDAWPEINEEDEPTVAQHLLVAADRYGLQRLKLMCEDRLLSHIDASSAASLLALAEQHQCPVLKNACFEFLLSSADSLAALVKTEDFDHLSLSCHAIVKEMISRLLLARDLEKAKLNELCRGIPLFPGITSPRAHALTMATDISPESGASNPSSATVVSEKARHILKIDGFSSTCVALCDFHFINSSRFRVAATAGTSGCDPRERLMGITRIPSPFSSSSTTTLSTSRR
jgi:speckle-type POZ protein